MSSTGADKNITMSCCEAAALTEARSFWAVCVKRLPLRADVRARHVLPP